jgi:hypothetical protein
MLPLSDHRRSPWVALAAALLLSVAIGVGTLSAPGAEQPAPVTAQTHV